MEETFEHVRKEFAIIDSLTDVFHKRCTLIEPTKHRSSHFGKFKFKFSEELMIDSLSHTMLIKYT